MISTGLLTLIFLLDVTFDWKKWSLRILQPKFVRLILILVKKTSCIYAGTTKQNSNFSHKNIRLMFVKLDFLKLSLVVRCTLLSAILRFSKTDKIVLAFIETYWIIWVGIISLAILARQYNSTLLLVEVFWELPGMINLIYLTSRDWAVNMFIIRSIFESWSRIYHFRSRKCLVRLCPSFHLSGRQRM